MRAVAVMMNGAALVVACGCAQPAEAPPPDTASLETPGDGFVGTWKLVSFRATNDGGETTYPMGEDAFGRIAYGDSGEMAVVLMRQGREERGAPGFFAYSGSYAIDAAASTVTHHIEACIDPSWIGGDRVRKFERLDDDRIALRPEEGTSELIWQRER